MASVSHDLHLQVKDLILLEFISSSCALLNRVQDQVLLGF